MPDQPSEVSPVKSSRLFSLAVFAVMGGAIVYLLSRDDASPQQDEQMAEMKAELENLKEMNLQLKEAELHRQRDQQLAESRLAGSRAKLDAASETIDQLEKAIRQWEQTSAALMTNSQGMRLAANSAALDQTEALLQAERPASTVPETLRATLRPLAELVQTAEKAEKEDRVSFDPGPEFTAELDGIVTQARPALTTYEEHNRRLAAILGGLPHDQPDTKTTLQDALAAREAQRLDEKNRKQTETLQAVHEENEKKRLEQQVAAKNRQAELELKKLEKEHELEELKLQAGITALDDKIAALGDEIDRQNKKRQLLREFEQDLPEIRSLLRPFIADGRKQPNRGMFSMTTTNGPVSLSALHRERLLEVKTETQRRLWSMAAGDYNDRDLGGFPSYIGNRMDWEAKQPAVQRAQELLIKYGDLMVEMEMLAP